MASSTTSEEELVNRFHGCNNSPGCFEESRFVNPSEIKCYYICSVGKGVLNDPKKVPCCDNAFCRYCIRQCTIPYNDEDGTFPQQERPTADLNMLRCPMCRKEFEANQLVNVCLNFKNELDEMRIRCSFKECKKVEPLGNIAIHELHCEWNPKRDVICSDCNKKLPQSDLKDHYCKEKVQKKYEDVENEHKEMKQELDKQKEIIEKLLA